MQILNGNSNRVVVQITPALAAVGSADMRHRHHDVQRFHRYIAEPEFTGCGPVMLRFLAIAFGLLGPLVASASAQDSRAAANAWRCRKRRRAPRRSVFAGSRRSPTKSRSPMPAIRPITSTRPAGLRIATDFSGAYTTGRLPDVVTMNRAHSTHYSLFPDPRIPHVLHGWGDDGKPAQIASASATSSSAT